MKSNYKYITLFLLTLILDSAKAQVTILNTSRPGTTPRFLGWDNTGTAGNLEIRNDFNNSIDLFTNGTQRMTILSGGNVGIGTASPVTGLHLNSTGTVGHFHFLVLWQ